MAPSPRSRFPAAHRLAAALLLSLATGAAGAEPSPFGLEQVAARAKALAAQPYKAPPKVPAYLRELGYDQWRAIRYRPDKALWHSEGRAFELQLFHPGFHFQHTVPVHLVTPGGVGRLAFEKSRFEYPDPALAERVPADLGYAGFRVHYPINRPDYKDEFAVFLGASYFRGIGAGQHYGLSARGLAVDTATANGEEFPRFRAYWIKPPAPEADRLTVYALLDSPSVTGAYRFVIAPGETTTMDVQARLFTRNPIAKLGIAPLTSMFLFGENGPHRFDDFRAEVHDSDGLLIASRTGEWLWRPLYNPRKLAVNSYVLESPRGFGLMQRDNAFANYQDLEARYERRPSAWVAPQGEWGKGRIELVQIPSESEKNDNIVAYWVPAEPVTAGQTLDFAYRLSWRGPDEALPPGGRTRATRVGRPSGGSQQPAAAREVVVDFAGGRLDELPAEAEVVPRVSVPEGARLLHADAFRNEVTGGWRMVFHVLAADAAPPLELRAYLAEPDGGALTETWTYALQP